MSSRAPFIVAVVGALLVGGVTTGSTHASWSGQGSVQSGLQGTGVMRVAITSESSVTMFKGTSATVDLTFSDTSQGKNLRQAVTPSASATNGLGAAVVTKTGATCSTTAQGAVQTTPGVSFASCVRITVPAATSVTSPTVTVAVAGAQQPRGWSATGSRAIAVSVLAPLTCPVQGSNRNQLTLSWPSVPGATGYELREDSSASGSFSTVTASLTGAPPPTSFTVTLMSPQTRYYRLVVTRSSGSQVVSNTLPVTRADNNGQVNTSCVQP